MNSILIINGTICNADSSQKADIAISGGKIIEIGLLTPEQYPGYQVIDAAGKLIFPGGVDPHVHLALPTPAGNSSDDFISGSRAAISGGTTSFIDFVTPRRGQSLIEALEMRKEEASASLCGHSLHMGISEWNPNVAAEVEECITGYGITSFKAYLAYRESIGIKLSDLKSLMEVVRPSGGIVMVHCEDGEMISELQQFFLKKGKTNAIYHALSHPPEAEIKAIGDVIELSAQTDCATYIVHTSTASGADLIGKAKISGLKVFGETCIQYLMLNDSVYNPSLKNIDILPFIISPPIRSETDRKQLWKGISNGTFDTVATDHCPFNLHGQKDRGMHDFTKIPNGAGGIEHRLSLLYTYGVLTGKITIEQFVSLTSTSPAEIFGLGNHKGKLKAGFDADIVIWNPESKSIISTATHVQHCDSDIYEGIEIQGNAETVFVKGMIAFRKGKLENPIQ